MTNNNILCMYQKEWFMYICIPYTGFFRGVKFSWFSWLRNKPRNIYPRKLIDAIATPIHVYTWLHTYYHVANQQVLDSVWTYFDTSRGKRTTYPILMAL